MFMQQSIADVGQVLEGGIAGSRCIAMRRITPKAPSFMSTPACSIETAAGAAA